jgi:hypothetical protein
MAWQTVNSSWLAAVDYRAEEMALYVRFKDKRGRFTVTARYDGVSPEVGFGLLNAESPGGYFHGSGLIRRRYTLV